MAGGTISITTTVWQKKIAQYAAQTGKNMKTALNEEFPLLLRKVMDFTPPFKTGGVPGSSDLSVGRAAVARDIYKTMQPFDPKNIRTKGLKQVVEEQDLRGFNIIAARSKSPLMKGKTAVFFSGNRHLSQRNKRGRVTRDLNQVVLGPGAGLLKQYVAEMQKRVGYAKSGWWKALRLVGGKAPAYVTKHGDAGGEVIDKRDDPDEMSITAINRTPWAVRKDEGDRILADAKLSRIEAIIRKIRFEERRAAKAAKLAA